MNEGRRLRLIGNIRNQMRWSEGELARIATMGDDEAASALRVLANGLLEQAAHAMELAMAHELAGADDDTLIDNERPEP
jgi:hypothetical protein